MHIGMILITDTSFPPDIRVEKEASALTELYKITVLARKANSNQSDHEKLDSNFYVRRFDLEQPRTLSKLISKFTLRRPEYYTLISRFITEEKPDVLHVHDLTFLPTVLAVAQKEGIPVVADLHENMPAALVAYRSALPWYKRSVSALFNSYHLWRWHEKHALTRCARIIVVVPEAAERLYKYGVPRERVVVVSNTEDPSRFYCRPEDCDQDILAQYKDYWMINYIGSIGPHRGLDTVLAALPKLRDHIPNLKLTIVGVQDAQKNLLKEMAEKLGVGCCVEVVESQPYKQMKAYIRASRIALVPHKDFEHTHTTVPHKLFQYMLCGVPMLVSNCKPLVRIVEDTESGYIFRANDVEDLKNKIVHVYENPEEAAARGDNGRKAASGSYDWRHDADRLLAMYAELEKEVQSG